MEQGTKLGVGMVAQINFHTKKAGEYSPACSKGWRTVRLQPLLEHHQGGWGDQSERDRPRSKRSATGEATIEAKVPLVWRRKRFSCFSMALARWGL